MYTIYIDTSKRYEKRVQLKANGRVVSERFGDIDVVCGLKELLEDSDVVLSQIERFEVNKGPGSFTGLRIGTTVANVLNWVTGKKDIEDLDLPEYGGEPNIHKTKWLDK